jgi:ribosomal protein S6--L-glutamate ligase
MRLGIVGWDYTEYESVHLLRASKARGHDATLFTLDDVSWGRVGDDDYGVLAAGLPAGEFDVIMSRAQLRRERWQSDLERLTLLSNLPGTPILDPAAEWVAAESKFIQMQRLGGAGVPVLPTVCCASVDDVRDAVGTWGDTVLKPSFGWEGNDVELVWAGDTLPDAVGRVLGRYETVLAQPYIPHPQGDMRLTVVDGAVVLSFRRVPGAGAWKANLAQGARAEPLILSAELVELALAATTAMGTTIAGVDIMRCGDGYVVMEINNGPGWHPLADEQEWAVANAIVGFAERVAKGDHGV